MYIRNYIVTLVTSWVCLTQLNSNFKHGVGYHAWNILVANSTDPSFLVGSENCPNSYIYLTRLN